MVAACGALAPVLLHLPPLSILVIRFSILEYGNICIHLHAGACSCTTWRCICWRVGTLAVLGADGLVLSPARHLQVTPAGRLVEPE